MATLDWETERTDGVTLVRVYVAADRPRRVRVANLLDGPVWPPRRRGQPAAGWDGDAFEGVVAPGDRLVAGYATPAPPADPPVELVADEPVGRDADGVTGTDRPTNASGTPGTPDHVGAEDRPEPPDLGPDDATPAGVVRSLGDPVVPRDAVPVPDPGAAANGHADRPSGGPEPDAAGSTSNAGDAATGAPPDDGRATRTGEGLVVPGAVRAWLADVERRVAAVEDSNATGTPLAAAVAGDRRAVAWVTSRAESLADRVDAGTVADRIDAGAVADGKR